MGKLGLESCKTFLQRVKELRYKPICSMTDPTSRAEVAPGQTPQRVGGRQLDALGWWGEVRTVVAVIKLHESLQSTGDPHNTRKQNPLRFSLALYRNVCWCLGYIKTYPGVDSTFAQTRLDFRVELWNRQQISGTRALSCEWEQRCPPSLTHTALAAHSSVSKPGISHLSNTCLTYFTRCESDFATA